MIISLIIPLAFYIIKQFFTQFVIVLFEKVKSALVWILLILNTMINALDFTYSKYCIYIYGLY